MREIGAWRGERAGSSERAGSIDGCDGGAYGLVEGDGGLDSEFAVHCPVMCLSRLLPLGIGFCMIG